MTTGKAKQTGILFEKPNDTSVPKLAPKLAPKPPTPHQATRQCPPRTPEYPAASVPAHTRAATSFSPATGPGGSPDINKLSLFAGAQIPGTRYRIVRWLGEGGMGVVYEVEHLDIERRVALKILRFDLSRLPQMTQVFRDEARAASGLGSPYIVEIFGFGELPDGRLFSTMELLTGGSLVPKRGDPLGVAQTLTILRQICKGLGTAHDAGVVHRDIKPENLLSATTKGRTHVKIVDFGISAMLATGPDAMRHGISGTPHYMAPEQILGEPFDGRLDIYALGCTAHELLTGVLPFSSDTLNELLDAHLSTPPVPLRKRFPHLNIPEEIDAIVLRCLEKRPKNRYLDMAELEAALCEAQIALKIVTDWDDLPVPEIADLERRTRIVDQMPSPVVFRERRGAWPILAATSTAAAALFAGILFLDQGPTNAARAVVDTLSDDIRRFAAQADWVIPPPGEPATATALAKVLELERLEGRAAALADTRGRDFRETFSVTLMRTADRLWNSGATGVARDYYLWSYLFDTSNMRSRKRSGATMGMIGELRHQAETGNFSDIDRVLGLVTRAEAEEEMPVKKRIFARASAAAKSMTLPRATQIVLANAMAPQQRQGPAQRDPDNDETGALAPSDPPSDFFPSDVAPALPPGPPSTARRSSNRSSAPAKTAAPRAPRAARALAAQGTAALRAGRRGDARRFFDQAISHDRENATALMGLSDIFFDTSSNQMAIIYAERAVTAAPRNKAFRLKLGDAYFKTLRYRDAYDAYQRAKRLGSSRASSRIDKVQRKLGETSRE